MSDDSSRSDKNHLSRRDFAVGGANLTLLALLGGATACKVRSGEGSVSADAAAPGAAPSTVVRERKNIWKLTPSDPDVIFYRAAIAKMTQLPRSNPLSWEGQAYIHVNSCPHGNWYFLPWHRVYLKHFEDIIQYWAEQAAKEVMDSDKDVNKLRLRDLVKQRYQFALPYWDWTVSLNMPTVVSADRQFNPNTWDYQTKYKPRNAKPGFDPEFMGSAAIASVLATRDFYAFASGKAAGQRDRGSFGSIEGIPHNNVHVAVGGEMERMTSPLDPIFWMHHCNVDRLWAHWAKNMGTRAVPAGADGELWKNFTMNGFFDKDGKAQTKKVVDTFDWKKMGFTYDSLEVKPTPTPTPTPRPKPVVLGLAGETEVEAKPEASDFSQRRYGPKNGSLNGKLTHMVFVDLGAISQFPKVKDLAAGTSAADAEFYLRIKNLPVPADVGARENMIKRLKFYFATSTDAKNTTSRTLATFGFFGLKHEGHSASSATLYYDITDVMTMIQSKTFRFGTNLVLGISMMDAVSGDGTDAMMTDDGQADMQAYFSALQNSGLIVSIS